MIVDWTGDKYVWKPYGNDNLQLDVSEGNTYAYNDAEQDRDLEHGYPSAYKSNNELTETVKDWI